MSEPVVWKKPPLLVLAGVAVCGLTFWVARATAPVKMSPQIVANAYVEEKTNSVSSTDWVKCVDGNTTPKKDGFEVMLRNKCSVQLDPFIVYFKLYDKTDARVGWDQTSVGTLEPGEKVRFVNPFNLKDNPKLADGVGRVQAFEFGPNK